MSDLRSLRPTQEQYQAFVEHLCEAHSWYKHLPLLQGTRFVVFLAPDAGSGRITLSFKSFDHAIPILTLEETGPEDAAFTEAHPRIHHSWQTTKEYRRRFGYLDYMFQVGEDRFDSRDAGPIVNLAPEVEQACSFELYPYVTTRFADSLTWGIHTKALQAFGEGAEHPARQRVLQLAYFVKKREAVRESLSEDELNMAFDRVDKTENLTARSFGLRKYCSLSKICDEMARSLQELELMKIRRALAALDDWVLKQSASEQ